MAWRVITPADMPDFILKEVSESTPGKRRKSAGRKKSSKSESEQDANTRNNVQEEIVKTGTPVITSKLALKVEVLILVKSALSLHRLLTQALHSND